MKSCPFCVSVYQIVQLTPNGGVIEDGCTAANFLPGFNLECYPNRDSTTYIDSLQLDTVHTILRGTLRYKVKTYIELFVT